MIQIESAYQVKNIISKKCKPDHGVQPFLENIIYQMQFFELINAIVCHGLYPATVDDIDSSSKQFGQLTRYAGGVGSDEDSNEFHLFYSSYLGSKSGYFSSTLKRAMTKTHFSHAVTRVSPWYMFILMYVIRLRENLKDPINDTPLLHGYYHGSGIRCNNKNDNGVTKYDNLMLKNGLSPYKVKYHFDLKIMQHNKEEGDFLRDFNVLAYICFKWVEKLTLGEYHHEILETNSEKFKKEKMFTYVLIEPKKKRARDEDAEAREVTPVARSLNEEVAKEVLSTFVTVARVYSGIQNVGSDGATDAEGKLAKILALVDSNTPALLSDCSNIGCGKFETLKHLNDAFGDSDDLLMVDDSSMVSSPNKKNKKVVTKEAPARKKKKKDITGTELGDKLNRICKGKNNHLESGEPSVENFATCLNISYNKKQIPNDQPVLFYSTDAFKDLSEVHSNPGKRIQPRLKWAQRVLALIDEAEEGGWYCSLSSIFDSDEKIPSNPVMFVFLREEYARQNLERGILDKSDMSDE